MKNKINFKKIMGSYSNRNNSPLDVTKLVNPKIL